MAGGVPKVWAVIGITVFNVSVHIGMAIFVGKKWSPINVVIGLMFLAVAVLRQWMEDRKGKLGGFGFGFLMQTTAIELALSVVNGGSMAYFCRYQLPLDMLLGICCACIFSSIILLNQEWEKSRKVVCTQR